jgi:hypothetical protein
MTGVDCETISEAEAYVRDFPRDSHGFASCGSINVPYTDGANTQARLIEMLQAAGYGSTEERWARPGYVAVATRHKSLRYARIYIYREGEHIALHSGEDGYLPHDDRPAAG